MNTLQQIQNFICIVDNQGISAAAQQQSITAAAASKRLQALEDYLGVRLLTRNTRSVAVTEAGHYYYSHQKRTLHELSRVDDYVKAMRGTVKGQLKINLPMSYGKYRLNPFLIRFLKEHPEVEIHCDYDDQLVDVNNGDYDVVIRVGSSMPDSDVVARKLETMTTILAISKDYQTENGMPNHPLDLKNHNCLLYSNMKNREMWTFKDANQKDIHVKVHGNFSSNNGESLTRAIKEGLGVGLIPQFLLNNEIEIEEVIPILTEYSLPEITAYAIFPSKQFLPEKIRVFIDFLVSNMNDK